MISFTIFNIINNYGELTMKNTKLLKLKEELKELAKSIKNKTYTSCYTRRDYRYMHIAYCLLRGRTYEQIEQKVHDQNVLDKRAWSKINDIMDKHKDDDTLYVVVCGNLNKSQQFVQGSHAVASHCIHSKDSNWNNRRLLVLKHMNLEGFIDSLKKQYIEFYTFFEPHYGIITAVASTKIGDLVKELNLV